MDADGDSNKDWIWVPQKVDIVCSWAPNKHNLYWSTLFLQQINQLII